jgi:hypothetical protein
LVRLVITVTLTVAVAGAADVRAATEGFVTIKAPFGGALSVDFEKAGAAGLNGLLLFELIVRGVKTGKGIRSEWRSEYVVCDFDNGDIFYLGPIKAGWRNKPFGVSRIQRKVIFSYWVPGKEGLGKYDIRSKKAVKLYEDDGALWGELYDPCNDSVFFTSTTPVGIGNDLITSGTCLRRVNLTTGEVFDVMGPRDRAGAIAIAGEARLVLLTKNPYKFEHIRGNEFREVRSLYDELILTDFNGSIIKNFGRLISARIGSEAEAFLASNGSFACLEGSALSFVNDPKGPGYYSIFVVSNAGRIKRVIKRGGGGRDFYLSPDNKFVALVKSDEKERGYYSMSVVNIADGCVLKDVIRGPVNGRINFIAWN